MLGKCKFPRVRVRITGSVHAEVQPYTILVWIARAVFLVEHRQTDATEHPTSHRQLYSRCG